MAKSNIPGTFKPGKEKTGGRQKGTPNRTTKEIREFMQQVFNENLETLRDDLAQMNPFMRRKTLADMGKYWMPTMTEAKVEQNNINTGVRKIQLVYEDEVKPADGTGTDITTDKA